MVFKRNSIYWYKFKCSTPNPDGSREYFVIRKTARTSSKREARSVEEEHRHAIRVGLIHPLDPWPRPQTPAIVSLREFTKRFLEFSQTHTKPKTVRFYRQAIDRLLQSTLLADTRLPNISSEIVGKYVAFRRARLSGNSIATINADLRTLRRILNVAEEWGLLSRAPVLHEIPGAKARDRVISPDEEAKYLRAACPMLQDMAIIAADTGMRPNSELFPLRWVDVVLDPVPEAPHGIVHIRSGKTESAMRTVPLTARANLRLRQRERESKSRFVFPGCGVEGHVMSLKHAHDGAIRRAKLSPFPFYCWRHTFGTRCAESGMDRFTLARLMGHSSPSISERYYIHVTEPHVGANFGKFLDYHSRLLLHGVPSPTQVLQ